MCRTRLIAAVTTLTRLGQRGPFAPIFVSLAIQKMLALRISAEAE